LYENIESKIYIEKKAPYEKINYISTPTITLREKKKKKAHPRDEMIEAEQTETMAD